LPGLFFMNSDLALCTAFDGQRQIASGALRDVALAVKTVVERGAIGPVLVFDDATGRVTDIDIRGCAEDVVARLAAPLPDADAAFGELSGERRGRGRPKLGVVAREVTLLPRHWEWLGTQSGGASIALRKLVDAARRAGVDSDRRRNARERAYHFMAAMAGDLPGFEEAIRALFADDRQRLEDMTVAWPEDVRIHALRLAT
jgi:hypothetical protein